MIIKDNLLRLRGFGAEPWEYQPTEPGTYVRSDTPSAEQFTQPVLEPEPTNYVMKESGNAYIESNPSTSSGGSGSSFDVVGLVNGVVGIVGQLFGPKPQQQRVVVQQAKPLIPPWVMPAAIVGGAGILAVAVLAKPRRGGSLAGYRRRKRRRSRR